VVVGTDKGLCGALNSSVFKRVHQLIAEKAWSKDDITIIAVGRKAHEHFAARGFTLGAIYHAPEVSAKIEDVSSIAERITDDFAANVVDEVYIAYTNFRSTFEQDAYIHAILPLSFDALKETVEGITPEKGKFAERPEAVPSKTVQTYLVEPNPDAVFNSLIPTLVAIELYHAFVESAASEHSARMVAMKNATDKAGEVSRSLTLKFNKARQAIITREVSEIVGGMEVMK
jgi:F-type H+-transporting ATPase subunit gamma